MSPGIASSFPVEYLGNKSKPEVTRVALFYGNKKWQLQEGRFIEDYDIDTLKNMRNRTNCCAGFVFNISPTGSPCL